MSKFEEWKQAHAQLKDFEVYVENLRLAAQAEVEQQAKELKEMSCELEDRSREIDASIVVEKQEVAETLPTPINDLPSQSDIKPAAPKKIAQKPEQVGKHKVTIPVGAKFNSWTVVRFAPEKSQKKQHFLCRCVCGTEKFINKYILNDSKSCGCHKNAFKARKPAGAKIDSGNHLQSSRQRIEAIKEQRALERELSDDFN